MVARELRALFEKDSSKHAGTFHIPSSVCQNAPNLDGAIGQLYEKSDTSGLVLAGQAFPYCARCVVVVVVAAAATTHVSVAAVYFHRKGGSWLCKALTLKSPGSPSQMKHTPVSMNAD